MQNYILMQYEFNIRLIVLISVDLNASTKKILLCEIFLNHLQLHIFSVKVDIKLTLFSLQQ